MLNQEKLNDRLKVQEFSKIDALSKMMDYAGREEYDALRYYLGLVIARLGDESIKFKSHRAECDLSKLLAVCHKILGNH